MNVLEFRAECVRHGQTLDSVARAIGVNKATLHRKMNGASKFTRDELASIKDILGLTDDLFMKIFFANEL